ncbi:MAG: 50S ribosomal protein L25 [Chloroflexia bacterium]|jgi:large subunit ribosomal protein L25|nr:50S ribosomal protein L25 [Chloroflexia bacterium]MDQ3614115.1 50S ribosomal protein L25 [Chloroflexota bacterium]
MADELILRAEPRTIHGKKVKRLRREGIIPGVVYGPVIDNTISVSVERRAFDKFYMRNGHSTIFKLVWDGGEETVLIREVQQDPVRRDPLHIDFFAPNLRVVLRTMVPVALHGQSEDMVGILNTILTEVEIEALPANLPHQIDADIAHLLAVGDHIRVEDLTMPEGVELITSSEETIATVAPETVEEEPEVEDVAEGEEAEEGEEAAEGEESTEDGGEDNEDS